MDMLAIDRLDELYKKHVRMAKKAGWRVYRSTHGGKKASYTNTKDCPFWHYSDCYLSADDMCFKSHHKWDSTSSGHPPFACRIIDEWNEASRLWMYFIRIAPSELRDRFRYIQKKQVR